MKLRVYIRRIREVILSEGGDLPEDALVGNVPAMAVGEPLGN